MALLRRASNHFYPPEKHSCLVRQISKDKFLIALYHKSFLPSKCVVALSAEEIYVTFKLQLKNKIFIDTIFL